MADTVELNNYPSITTDAGKAAMAAAMANGTSVKIAAVAVGQPGGEALHR